MRKNENVRIRADQPTVCMGSRTLRLSLLKSLKWPVAKSAMSWKPKSGVADPGSGLWDPGSGAFLTPVSGIRDG
jgi:hypothetical protein